MAQACHASNAALQQFRDDAQTREYVANVPNMTTIILSIKDAEELRLYCDKLNQEKVDFCEWIEMPERLPTAIALKPYYKAQLPQCLQRLKLFK